MSKQREYPLMPKATAIWLVENTALTFKQISEFCGMHELEVKGIADGEVATGIMGVDPVTAGNLEKDEIARCSSDPEAKLTLKRSLAYEAATKSNKRKTAKYTPVARRQDKPDAIFWLLKSFPEIKNLTIVKLIGTTNKTIDAIRDKTHWNMSGIRPRDPVLLGVCSQVFLDNTIAKAKLEITNKNI